MKDILLAFILMSFSQKIPAEDGALKTRCDTWNQLTLQSMDKQINNPDSQHSGNVAHYRNKKKQFELLMEIGAGNGKDQSSIRCEFLKMVNLPIKGKDIYMLECSRAGGKNMITNFFIYKDVRTGFDSIMIYTYLKNGWLNNGYAITNTAAFPADWDRTLVPNETGGNYDDIIISLFSVAKQSIAIIRIEDRYGIFF